VRGGVELIPPTIVLSMYRIRLASVADPPLLPAIESEAATLFRAYFDETGLSEAAIEHTNSVEDFAAAQRNGLLWVAVDQEDAPIGFAMLRRFEDVLHLHEIDVHPAHARLGLGHAMIERIREWARDNRFAAITLTTYRNVPWNAPYYRRMGFRDLDEREWTPALRGIWEKERAMGWKLSARVAMRLDLSTTC
jgi:GNAT superfamily N-acetyltransferase